MSRLSSQRGEFRDCRQADRCSLLAVWLIPDWSRWCCPKPSGARWITGLSAGRPRRGAAGGAAHHHRRPGGGGGGAHAGGGSRRRRALVERELAKRVGISPASVLRIWHAFGLQPWRTEAFKISPDPLLIDKIRDVTGLYLARWSTPRCSRSTRSRRSRPCSPLRRCCPCCRVCPSGSHDYIRHGTVGLLAALNTATGKVIGKLSARHRAVDFRYFLGDIDRQTEPGLAIHVICDNLFCSHQAAWRRATSTRRRRPAAECPLPVPACAEQLAHPQAAGHAEPPGHRGRRRL
jgi:hypothetical protein